MLTRSLSFFLKNNRSKYADAGNIDTSLNYFIAAIICAVALIAIWESSAIYIRAAALIFIVALIYLGSARRSFVGMGTNDYERQQRQWSDYLSTLSEKKALSDKTLVLDNAIDELDPVTIQKMIKYAEHADLTIALSGASGRVLKMFYQNMGSRGAMMLRDDMKAVETNEDEINQTQKKILDKGVCRT